MWKICTCKILPAKFNFNREKKKSFSNFKSKFYFDNKIPILFTFFLFIFLDIVLLGIEKKSFPFPTKLSIKNWIHFFFSNISNFQGKSINFMPQYFFLYFFVVFLFVQRENSKGWKKKWKICYNIFRLVI